MPLDSWQLRASQNMTRLAKYSTELFQSLESITGQATYQQTGSITLALNGNARRLRGGRPWPMPSMCEWVEPDFIANQWPGITLSDARARLPAGRWSDHPIDTTLALAEGKQEGALIIENSEVTGWSSLTVP